MNEITVSAKTLDDAITEASIQLGVASDQLEVDVIEKGSAGFLGIGSRQAVIRARRKYVEPEPEIEIFTVKKEEIKPEAHKAEEKRVEKKERKENKEFKERKKDFNNKKENNRNNNKKDFNNKKEFNNNKKEFNNKKDNKKEHYKKNDAPKPAKVIEAPVAPVEEKKKDIEIAVVTEETKVICEKFLQDVLSAMGMENVVLVSEIDEEGALAIQMDGKNMGILIGKRGQTLDSLQYLTNRVANKSQDGYVRVKLDTEDYRRRRKQTLENLAKNIAYKVKRSRKPVSLEPMNPYERRIIHSALQADDRVSTHSEGEEPYRRVVVTPNRR